MEVQVLGTGQLVIKLDHNGMSLQKRQSQAQRAIEQWRWNQSIVHRTYMRGGETCKARQGKEEDTTQAQVEVGNVVNM